jgi:antitoxin component of MazEF toxin-antitoxin module
MIKRLRKVGNGNALLLDKALMELVGLRENGQVQLTVRDSTIIIAPANPQPIDPARFKTNLDRVMARRRSALRKLAE